MIMTPKSKAMFTSKRNRGGIKDGEGWKPVAVDGGSMIAQGKSVWGDAPRVPRCRWLDEGTQYSQSMGRVDVCRESLRVVSRLMGFP